MWVAKEAVDTMKVRGGHDAAGVDERARRSPYERDFVHGVVVEEVTYVVVRATAEDRTGVHDRVGPVVREQRNELRVGMLHLLVDVDLARFPSAVGRGDSNIGRRCRVASHAGPLTASS